MMKDSIWAILAGILLCVVVVLVIDVLLFPKEVAMLTIPVGAFIVFLWLNAYRISRKRQTSGSTVNPSI